MALTIARLPASCSGALAEGAHATRAAASSSSAPSAPCHRAILPSALRSSRSVGQGCAGLPALPPARASAEGSLPASQTIAANPCASIQRQTLGSPACSSRTHRPMTSVHRVCAQSRRESRDMAALHTCSSHTELSSTETSALHPSLRGGAWALGLQMAEGRERLLRQSGEASSWYICVLLRCCSARPRSTKKIRGSVCRGRDFLGWIRLRGDVRSPRHKIVLEASTQSSAV